MRVVTLLALIALATPAAAAEIDACKYVAVTELARDPYGIVEEVRKQAAARGFIVVTETAAVPVADAFKACVITADWLGGQASGEVVLQVMDAVNRNPRRPGARGRPQLVQCRSLDEGAPHPDLSGPGLHRLPQEESRAGK